MKKVLLLLMFFATAVVATQAKTLVAYYSYTNNSRTIANALVGLLPDTDILEIQPAEEGLDYAANGNALGNQLVRTILNAPYDSSSYPPIKDVDLDLDLYDEIVIVAPLWWTHMAPPMQTFLFKYGNKMAGKGIGLVVSSGGSPIYDVESDANRLIPQGVFLESLLIYSYQTSSCGTILTDWITRTGIGTLGIADAETASEAISIDGTQLTVYGNFDRIAVYNTVGKQLIASTSHVTDLSSLPIGQTYIAIIQGADSTIRHKFVLR